MTHVTARAYPNIALVKYWGKADEQLIVPVAGSMSMTLDDYATTTTVALRDRADQHVDQFSLNGTQAEGTAAQRVTDFLDHVRQLAAQAGLETAAHTASVTSVNEGPTAAGMASSASGFAALALAASAAYGLELTTQELSRLARRGSGSACRSVIDRFAIWHAGHDDATSYAEPLEAPDMAMIAVPITAAAKKVSSRAGMQATEATSPYYPAWITTTHTTLTDMVQACRAGDFTRIGEITETHAMRMHAVIEACDPPIRYLAPRSYEVFDAVAGLREHGTEAYATADAGPNVVVITRPEDAVQVATALAPLAGSGADGQPGQTRILRPGRGAHRVDTPVEGLPV